MNRRVLERLEAVAVSWSRCPGALGLMGCGSVGVETHRLDAFSDLDFFAVVEPEFKQRWVQDLSWLEAVGPLAYRFANGDDAWQVMFYDGLYAEFGVVTPADLSRIPYAEARVVWAAPGFDPAWARAATPPPTDDAAESWLVGQALSFLYVGLCRYRRGEVLSGWKYVQVQAFDAVLRLWDRLPVVPAPTDHVSKDLFSVERRFEARHPGASSLLGQALRGYDGTPASAIALVEFLERHANPHPAMTAAIRRLAEEAISPPEPLHRR